MHTACVLCVFWTHASDFVTSRPFLMRLLQSAFDWKRVRAVSLMRQHRNRFYAIADHTRRIRKWHDVTISDACARKMHRTHAVCIQLKADKRILNLTKYFNSRAPLEYLWDLAQCFSTFLMSQPTFRRDFDFGPTSRKICFRTHD